MVRVHGVGQDSVIGSGLGMGAESRNGCSMSIGPLEEV